VLTWGCPDDGRLGQAASPDDEPDDGTPVCAPARVHVEGFIDQVARAKARVRASGLGLGLGLGLGARVRAASK
jgi:hypothetical protein